MPILIMTAVEQEREAVRRGLPAKDGRFQVLSAGVGPIAAAVATALALTKENYDLVISAGIGGGFSHRAPVGSLVVATEIIAADLGVDSPEGFCSLDRLGFGSTRISPDQGLVSQVTGALLKAGLPVNSGPVLTVSTATGTAAGAASLLDRIPEAVAEAMEGFGVAFAAQEQAVPVLELRAISNLVGPRDRGSWRIAEALHLLESALAILAEVLA